MALLNPDSKGFLIPSTPMKFTHSPSNMLAVAGFNRTNSTLKIVMVGVSLMGKYFKILWSVVGSVSVSMVDNFFAMVYRSPKNLLHHEDMLKHVSVFSGSRVIRSEHHNVSLIPLNISTTLPSWMTRAFPGKMFCRFPIFVTDFFRSNILAAHGLIMANFPVEVKGL